MKIQRIGTVVAGIGAVYLVAVAWMSSWWYVPVLVELESRVVAEHTPYGGTTFFIAWASSGVLGAILVAVGAAVYCAVGKLRLLLLAAGGALLAVWLAFWSASSHNPVVFGLGGGLILLCFLTSCLDWAQTRGHGSGPTKVASDLRLSGYVSFFIAAWRICGLLDAPTFALRPELTTAASSLAVKVLVCLVLGWVFTAAAAQRMERRGSNAADQDLMRRGKIP